MIYTSYFDNIENLPKDIITISICGKSPEIYTGIQYKKLAPKWSFFLKWKENKDNDYYIRHFNVEVLDNLNPHEVVKKLYELSNNKDICLICYEKPEEFCHRHLVANWLKENGYCCEEYKIS